MQIKEILVSQLFSTIYIYIYIYILVYIKLYIYIYIFTSIVVYDLPLIDTTNKITISHMITRDQEVHNKHIIK